MLIDLGSSQAWTTEMSLPGGEVFAGLHATFLSKPDADSAVRGSSRLPECVTTKIGRWYGRLDWPLHVLLAL